MRPLLIEIEPNIATVTAGRRRPKRVGAELPQGANGNQASCFHTS